MSKDLNMLYELSKAEGTLTWAECQRINAALVDIQEEFVPRYQLDSVCEYLEQVFLWQSAVPEHRARLAKLLSSIGSSNAYKASRGRVVSQNYQ